LLHPGFDFTLQPAGAATQLDGLRELAFADEFVEPFIRHFGIGGDECHIDKLVAQQCGGCVHGDISFTLKVKEE